MAPAGKVTMSDVARLAGVSKMTVSRVLAEPGVVSEATRDRVKRAIEQLSYVPDSIASSLSSRRTRFVSLILPTLVNSNFADTAQGLAEALRPADYQLLIGYTMYRLDEEERVIRAMLSRRPEAIVIAGITHTKPAQQMLHRAGIPVIEIWDAPIQPIDRAVGFSNYEVGLMAARHLLDLGHRRIGALGSNPTGDALDLRGEARLQGFGAALRGAGLNEDLILRDGQAPVSYDHGAHALGLLLERAPDVEAVFAVSDVSALGALMECQRRGIRVPGDLSLMGFGDFDIARHCVPALTTIRIDAVRIGRTTGEVLLDILRNSMNPGTFTAKVTTDVGFALVARESTAEAALHD